MGFGPEQTGEQVGHRKIDIEDFPVQASATTQHLNLGELVFGGAPKPLCKPWREGEGAAIGKFDDYALARAEDDDAGLP